MLTENEPSDKPLSFAERILKKHGWKSGEGLGKNSQGIAEPIRPSLKFDKTGVGHDPAKEFTSTWWNDAYKKAADNVIIDNEQDGGVKINWKEKSKGDKGPKSNVINSQYTAFIQSATLDGGKLVNKRENICDEQSDSCKINVSREPKKLTDEELFAACGGLTAHKGARHGHKMSAKQKRLEMQEEALMEKMKRTYKLEEKTFSEKKPPSHCNIPRTVDEYQMPSNSSKSKKKKHKDKKKKSKSERPNDNNRSVCYETANLNETDGILIEQKSKKRKSKRGSKTEELHGNEPFQKTMSKEKKKRKSKDSDNCDTSNNKKLCKEM